jgi:hypothetical protein
VKLVKVRVSGDATAFAAVLDVLIAAAQGGAFEVAEVSALYPNRRDPGYRVYLTLAVPGSADTTHNQRRAAHSRQAIRRPAAALPAKETQGRKHLP